MYINDLICIYNDTIEDVNKLLLDIYANFVERELKNIEDI